MEMTFIQPNAWIYRNSHHHEATPRCIVYCPCITEGAQKGGGQTPLNVMNLTKIARETETKAVTAPAAVFEQTDSSEKLHQFLFQNITIY
jgi:hypothetical protein